MKKRKNEEKTKDTVNVKSAKTQQKRLCGRFLAVLLAAGLSITNLTACGKAEHENNVPTGNNSANGTVPEQSRGRYVEKEEKLPEELADWTIQQMYAAEGRLRFLVSKQENEGGASRKTSGVTPEGNSDMTPNEVPQGKIILREWEKQGDSFVDVTQEWLSSLELPCDWLEAQLMQTADGRQYLYASYVADGEDAYKGHLWKGAGDRAEEITPEKWAVPNEDWGSYEMIQGLAALDDGTLISVSYSSVDILSGEDGSILKSEPLTSYYEGRPVTDGENVYLSAGGQIEKRNGGDGNAVLIPMPRADADSALSGTNFTFSGGGASIAVGGSGSLLLDVMKDGTLIAAGEDGIFRLPGRLAGQEDGQTGQEEQKEQEDQAGTSGESADANWEKLAEGVETDFAMGNYQCTDLTVLEDGNIYALFVADGERKLNRYEYDPNAVTQVTQVLRLYTITESSLLKQAAVLYHKAHPEVLITIEHEYPMYFYDLFDYNAVYQKLNTMLLGDEAPDILVMDGLNIDSYAAKGLLVDLDEMIRPMEDSGELLSNITGAFAGEDKKRYAVPLQFRFHMALGRDITAENMNSIENLAEFLSKSDYSYLGPQTAAELVDKFYPYFCEEIVKDKQLDKEVLGRYLEYLKVIGDNSGILNTRPEKERAYDMWDLAAGAKLAFQEVGGFTDCMFPVSMAEYIKGDFAAFENSFSPSLQMGICTKSPNLDTAKDFLRFALSEEVQDMEYEKGFPVNRESLKKQASKDRSGYMASVVIAADDGGYTSFDSEPYSQETAQKLELMCETLDRPVKEDAKIREVLAECLGGYLDGSQSKEETIQKIEAGLKMYLAE